LDGERDVERVVDPLITLKRGGRWSEPAAFAVMIAFFGVAPAIVYPVFLMKVLCFALFACAFNLLIGYAGLLSFAARASISR
jgi:branched-chain amino acid transport system permease protein